MKLKFAILAVAVIVLTSAQAHALPNQGEGCGSGPSGGTTVVDVDGVSYSIGGCDPAEIRIFSKALKDKLTPSKKNNLAQACAVVKGTIRGKTCVLPKRHKK